MSLFSDDGLAKWTDNTTHDTRGTTDTWTILVEDLIYCGVCCQVVLFWVKKNGFSRPWSTPLSISTFHVNHSAEGRSGKCWIYSFYTALSITYHRPPQVALSFWVLLHVLQTIAIQFLGGNIWVRNIPFSCLLSQWLPQTELVGVDEIYVDPLYMDTYICLQFQLASFKL